MKPTTECSTGANAAGRWRLHTTTRDGHEKIVVLTPGTSTLGSGRDDDVTIVARGVSRGHARLEVSPGAVIIEDQASKNGVRVNGRRIHRQALADGDEVGLGTTVLTVEAVSAEEAELGLAVTSPRAAPPPPQSATTHLDDGPGTAAAWLHVLDGALAVLSASPGGDRDRALATLIPALGIDGAAMFSWQANGARVVVASAGTVGEPVATSSTARHDADEAAREDGAFTAFPVVDGAPGAGWTVKDGDRGWSLVLWGEFVGRNDSRALLAPLLRALLLAGPREATALPLPLSGNRSGNRAGNTAGVGPASTAGADALRFPTDYVPGDAPAMQALYRHVAPLVAAGGLPVLIVGETGVGKEPLARTLHDSSPRQQGPFVPVNCAAIPAPLLESEMFGIEAGVATGVRARRGRFADAHGGTLFLDEIGELPTSLQAKLLRVLQEGEVQPVGRAGGRAVDVRVVAATNRDLRREVEAGRFRRDLYFRIAGSVVTVPPLRARAGDVARLAGHFLRRFGAEAGRCPSGLTVKALRHLETYAWPGNVRELQHEMRRLVFQCANGGVVDSEMLSDHLLVPSDEPESPLPAGEGTLEVAVHTAVLRRRLVTAALARTEGNRSQAADLLGVSRNTVALWISELEIDEG